MKRMLILIGLVAPAGVTLARPVVPSEKTLRPAVQKYLEEKGHFCLGKFDWPITVTEHDRQIVTNDSVQMPVFEKLGLVTVSTPADDPTLRRYELTPEGRKYYLVKPMVSLGPGEQPVEHRGDFCAATLTLDRVVKWDKPTLVDGHPRTIVTYTYKVASAADWTRDPQVQKVFPMIHRIVDGAGTMQLVQAFSWTNHAWVALTPGS